MSGVQWKIILFHLVGPKNKNNNNNNNSIPLLSDCALNRTWAYFPSSICQCRVNLTSLRFTLNVYREISGLDCVCLDMPVYHILIDFVSWHFNIRNVDAQEQLKSTEVHTFLECPLKIRLPITVWNPILCPSKMFATNTLAEPETQVGIHNGNRYINKATGQCQVWRNTCVGKNSEVERCQ